MRVGKGKSRETLTNLLVALLEDGGGEPRGGIDVTAAIEAGVPPVEPQVVGAVLPSGHPGGGSQRHDREC